MIIALTKSLVKLYRYIINLSVLPGDKIERSVKPDWVDRVVGIRWLHDFNKEWIFQAQADIGGFGIISEFTSTLATGVQYKMSDSMTLNIKYKATWIPLHMAQL